MNKRALFLLGLVAGCSACWQTKPVELALQTTFISSCPQRAVVTVGGASLVTKPEVTLATTVPATGTTKYVTIDPAEVSILPSGLLQFALPRELPAGTYQVALKFTAADNEESVLRPGSFEYSLDTPNLTNLVSRLELTGPSNPVDVALWHPDSSRGLELAVLANNGTTLTTYANTQAGFSKLPMFSETPSQTVSAASGNLIRPELDPAQQPGVRRLSAGTQLQNAGTTAVGLLLMSDGATQPVLRPGPAVDPTYLPIKRQLVAAGYFQKEGDPIQIAAFLGASAGKDVPVVYYKTPTSSPTTPGVLTPVTTLVDAPQPLAVVTAELNGDLFTDAILIIDKLAGLNQRSMVAVAIPGGTQRAAYELLGVGGASAVVALGDLDRDGLPELVFGQVPSGIAIYYNRSAQGAAITYAATPADVQSVGTTAMVKALSVIDYDGDGLSDIVYVASDGVHVMVNHGVQPGDSASARKFDDSLVFSAPASWNPVTLFTTDFAGDLRPDFVVADQTSGRLWFLENTCSFP